MTDQDAQDKTVTPKPTEEKMTEQSATTSVKKEEAPKSTKSLSKNLERIIEEIEKLSVLELADLVKALEEKFGISSQPMIAPTGQAQPAIEEKAEEGQTIFNVILASAGGNKIAVIKAVRELVPTLGLKEAKDLVEAAPKEVMSGVNKATAEEAKKKITEAGGQVEVK